MKTLHLPRDKPVLRPRKPHEPTHTQLLHSIMEYLHYHGGTFYRNLGGIGQTRGRADICGCLRGRYVAIEGKVGRDTMSPKQLEEKWRLEQAGALVIVARRVEDVEIALLDAGLVKVPSLF